MKHVVAILLFSFCTMFLYAQKVSLSEKEDLNMRNDDFAVIGKYNDMTAIYKNHAAIGELIFYDKNLLKEKVSTLSFIPASLEKIHFAVTAKSIVVYYVVKENRKLNVLASKLKEDLSWSEPLIIDSSPAGSYRFNADYVFCNSEDQSKTFVYKSYTENGTAVLHAKVYDNELNSLVNIENPFSERDFFVTDIASVSNNGNAYILAADKQNAKSSFDLVTILSFKKGALNNGSTSLNLNKYSVRDIHLKMDETNHNLFICGYFSEGKYSAPRGVYYSIFNEESLTVGSSFFTPLTLQISSGHSDLRDMNIRDIYLTRSGEVEMVAEKNYQNSRSVSSITPVISSSFMMSNMQENARVVQEYSYDEIVLFHFKTDGSLAWNQNILKEQTSTDDNGIFSSYGVLQNKLGKAFLFNDLSSKQSRLLSSYVSSNGQLTVKEVQLSTEVDDWNLMPRSAVQVSKSEILIPCVSKSYLCFLKISF